MRSGHECLIHRQSLPVVMATEMPGTEIVTGAEMEMEMGTDADVDGDGITVAVMNREI